MPLVRPNPTYEITAAAKVAPLTFLVTVIFRARYGDESGPQEHVFIRQKDPETGAVEVGSAFKARAIAELERMTRDYDAAHPEVDDSVTTLNPPVGEQEVVVS